MLKYYASNTKILNYKIPEDFDDRLKTSIEKAREEVKHLLAKLLQEHGEEIKAVAEDLKPCPYCSTQHFIEYVLIQILNRALVEALQEHRYPALEGM
jgi:DNA repair exonuclease SbcCD ATPase subunit